ncbi:MAG TPA: c-type cytochrome [Bryobacteraceae bacterium]|nr:c-type cytochrome [Bryobacteraceae bacterium]
MTTARALASAVLGALLAVSGCGRAEAERAAEQLTGGDPARGRVAIQKYGCAACHTIPGIAGANGLVGPPLTGVATRVYLAGVLANTPDNMVRWITHPRQVDEKTAMPEMGVTEREARDIAAYLYSIR